MTAKALFEESPNFPTPSGVECPRYYKEMGIVLWVEQSLILTAMCCTAVWNLEFPRGSGGQNIWSTGSLCQSADSPPPPAPYPLPPPSPGYWPMARVWREFTKMNSGETESILLFHVRKIREGWQCGPGRDTPDRDRPHDLVPTLPLGPSRLPQTEMTPSVKTRTSFFPGTKHF